MPHAGTVNTCNIENLETSLLRNLQPTGYDASGQGIRKISTSEALHFPVGIELVIRRVGHEAVSNMRGDCERTHPVIVWATL